jgi:hypothetical protein
MTARAALSEKDWQAQVIAEAARFGWLVYHTYDSRRSTSGFPDLVLVHPQRGVIFAELKSDKGKTSSEQDTWLAALRRGADTGAVDVEVWRPSDATRVWTRLARR